jgi:hypothetical protein
MSSLSARRPRLVVAVLAAVLAVVGLLPGVAGAVPSPQVYNLGTAPFLGDMRGLTLNWPIVDLASTPSRNGYWEVASDGGIFTFGDAQFFGSTGNLILNRPIVAIAGTNSGLGYYLLSQDGGLFTFGDAGFFGSGAGASPVLTHTDLVVDPVRGGYWLLTADGLVTAYGATGLGSQPAPPGPLAPGVSAVAIASTPTGNGLWVAYSNGTVDAFGDATDVGDGPAGASVVDMTASPDGTGIWLVTSTGGVEPLGAVTRTDDAPVDRPAVAIVAHSADGYWVTTGGDGPGAIVGRVLDDLGNPAADACVSVVERPVTFARTGGDGRFRIPITPGSYRLRIGRCQGDDRWVDEYYKDADTFGAATVVVVNGGQDTVLDDVSLQRTATVTGVVTKPDGTPLQGACALSIADDGAFGGQVGTSITGYYRMTGLRPARYNVSFSDCTNDEYLPEYYDDAPVADLATPVTVAAGQTKTGIDAELAKAGAITGTVVTEDGGALAFNDSCVTATDDRGTFKQVPIQTGAYRLKGLGTGSYKVHFNDCLVGQQSFGGPNDYLDEWWSDQPSDATAAPVSVTAGADTTGIDAVLARAATISGTVTQNGAPALFQCVDAVQGSTSVRRTTTTSPTGFYQLRGLRDQAYTIRFGGCTGGGNQATEWWPNAPSQAAATPITLTPAEQRTGVDAVLDPAGFLEGHVTDSSGTPVRACVDVYDEATLHTRTTANWNGITGFYRIAGLNTNSYTFRFADCRVAPTGYLASQWFDGAASRSGAAPVAAQAGQTLQVATAVLQPEGVISGVVTSSSGGPASNVRVRAFAPDGSEPTELQNTVLTTVTGFYRIERLTAATYRVKFDPSSVYLGEWWDDAATMADADPVAVTAGATTSGIDAVLARRPGTGPDVPAAPATVLATAGQASATVSWSRVAGTHGPITGYRVTASPGGATQTFAPDADRNATFTGLTPGQTYTFTVQASTASGYGAGTVSNPVTPPGPPGAPGKPAVVAGDHAVTVSWTAAAANGSPITEYVIVASSDGAERRVAGDATSVVFDGRTNGVASTYTVTAINGAGTGPASPPSDAISSAGVPTAPGKPTATRGDGSVSLSWAASDPNGRVVDNYVVRASSDGAELTVAGDVTAATFGGRTNGVSETFTVRAINAVGSSAASPASDAVVPAGVPATPGKPTVVAGDHQVTVSWAATNANGSTLTEYVVTASSDGAQRHVAGNVTSVVFDGRTNGVSSTYRVHAVNAVGASADSVPSDAVSSAGVPTAPGKPVATAGDRSVALTWAASDPNGRALTSYVIRASSDGAEVTVPGDVTSATFGGRTNGVPDTFTVRGINAIGTSAASPASNLVVPAAVPGIPPKPIVVPGNGSVLVTWTAPPANGSAITEYVLTASSDGAELHVAAAVTTATFPGRPNGVASTYTVRAVNGVGSGPASPPSDSVAPSAPPAPPSSPDPESIVAGQTEVEALPAGVEVALTGSGFKPFVPGEVVINSTPRKLGTFVTDANGAFSVVVTIPSTMDLGNHTLVATALAPDGTVRSLATPVVVVSPAPAGGYRLVAADGGLFTFGSSTFEGSAGGSKLAAPIVAAAATPSGKGYWMAGADGLVVTFGDANHFGSLAGTKLNRPIVGMAATPSGKGYWLVATDGGIFAFGDAAFLGSTGDLRLNQPIVGMATTPSGKGYWLVASDGGIFAFGDAAFLGSTGALRLNKPIVGMAASPTGLGYWLVASDGGIFSFGDAAFFGSTGDLRLNQPIVAMSATPRGDGYRLVASDGGIFTFGDAAFLGSTGDLRLSQPILAIV